MLLIGTAACNGNDDEATPDNGSSNNGQHYEYQEETFTGYNTITTTVSAKGENICTIEPQYKFVKDLLNNKMSLTIPKHSIDGTVIPQFTIADIESKEDKTYAKEYVCKDSLGNEHKGTISLVYSTDEISGIINDKYSLAENEITYTFCLNFLEE